MRTCLEFGHGENLYQYGRVANEVKREDYFQVRFPEEVKDPDMGSILTCRFNMENHFIEMSLWESACIL